MVLDLWLEMKIGCRDDNLFFLYIKSKNANLIFYQNFNYLSYALLLKCKTNSYLEKQYSDLIKIKTV